MLPSNPIASTACSQRRAWRRGQRASADTGLQQALKDATAGAAGTEEGLWAIIKDGIWQFANARAYMTM